LCIDEGFATLQKEGKNATEPIRKLRRGGVGGAKVKGDRGNRAKIVLF